MNATKALLAGAICLALGTSPAMADSHGRDKHDGDADSYRISFTKCFDSPVPAPYVYWMAGSVGRDVVGTLHVGGYVLEPVGTLYTYLEADYIVAAGDRSFTARLGGRLINATGEAQMSGFVSDGWLEGAQITNKLHATGPGCFAGTLRVVPQWVSDDD